VPIGIGRAALEFEWTPYASNGKIPAHPVLFSLDDAADPDLAHSLYS
jgi:hypothetical protein